MATDEATVTASWEAPSWAESSDTDEQAVVHTRHVGSLTDLDGQQLRVDVVQRDDLCLLPGGAMVVREPVWLRVAESRLSLDQALRLARLVLGARRAADPPRQDLLEYGWRRLPTDPWRQSEPLTQRQTEPQAQGVAGGISR
jgi:hypothetical protein